MKSFPSRLLPAVVAGLVLASSGCDSSSKSDSTPVQPVADPAAGPTAPPAPAGAQEAPSLPK